MTSTLSLFSPALVTALGCQWETGTEHSSAPDGPKKKITLEGAASRLDLRHIRFVRTSRNHRWPLQPTTPPGFEAPLNTATLQPSATATSSEQICLLSPSSCEPQDPGISQQNFAFVTGSHRLQMCVKGLPKYIFLSILLTTFLQPDLHWLFLLTILTLHLTQSCSFLAPFPFL